MYPDELELWMLIRLFAPLFPTHQRDRANFKRTAYEASTAYDASNSQNKALEKGNKYL